MRIRRLLVAAFAAACAPQGRYVALDGGKTQQDYYRAHSKCRALAAQTIQGQPVDMMTVAYHKQVLHECMYGEGYRWVEDN
jgi:hypothetical protein